MAMTTSQPEQPPEPDGGAAAATNAKRQAPRTEQPGVDVPEEAPPGEADPAAHRPGRD